MRMRLTVRFIGMNTLRHSFRFENSELEISPQKAVFELCRFVKILY